MLKKLLYIPLLLLTLSVSAQQSTTFSGVVGFSEDHGNFTNTTGGGWNKNMLTSQNFIAPNTDGSVSYAVASVNNHVAFGLSVATSSIEVSDIRYQMMTGKKLNIWKNGDLLGDFGSLDDGDVLTIRREEDQIVFEKNGKKIYATTTLPELTLYVKVSTKTENLTIPSGDFRGKYYEEMVLTYTWVGHSCLTETLGSIDLTVTKGVSPYTYAWNNEATTQDLTGLTVGNYAVTVTDGTGNTKNTTVVIPLNIDCILQEGPGGVGHSSDNALWLDASSILESGNINQWLDVSGNNNHLSQGVSGKQPIINASGINGRPSVQFDGTDDYLQSNAIPSLNTDQITTFYVYDDVAPTTGPTYLLAGNYSQGAGGAQLWGTYMYPTSFIDYARGVTGSVYSLNSIRSFQPSIQSSVCNGATSYKAFHDGVDKGEKIGADMVPAGHNHLRLGADSYLERYYFNGPISEVIVYNKVLNNAQRIIVESYLSAKYSITTVNDKYTYDATHPNEVIGVGRESSIDFHNRAKGKGVLGVISNNLNDGEYILIGHDNALLKFETSDVPLGVSGSARLNRVWRADLTGGSSGNVDLVFDVSAMTLSDINNIDLLIESNDGVFGNGDVQQIASTEVDLVAGEITFKNVTLTDGVYIGLLDKSVTLSVLYTATEETPTSLGSIELTPFGGAGAYYYFWSGGQGPNMYNLESGDYNVTIVDTLGDSLSVNIQLPTEAQFETLASELSFENNILSKTGPDGWTNGMATLKNQIIDITTQGEIIVEISELGNEFIYGLRADSESSTAAFVYDDLNFGFYITEANELFTYDVAGGLLSFGSVIVGDDLSIEKNDETLNYKKNDIVIREIPITGDYYKIDFSLKKFGNLGLPIKIIKLAYEQVRSTITHSTCFLNNGEITVTYNGNILYQPGPLGNVYPICTWTGPNGFTASTSTISNLPIGTYTVTINPGNGNIAPRSYAIGYKVNWIDKVNTETEYLTPPTNIGLTNTLINTGENTDQNYGGNGGASSNTLPASTYGYAEFTVNNAIYDYLVFGLSGNNPNQDVVTIDYGIELIPYVAMNSTMITIFGYRVSENALGTVTPGILPRINGNYETGDKFKIERLQNGDVVYSKNDVPFYTNFTAASTAELIVDASMNMHDATILNANTSFLCKDSPYIYGHLKKKLEGGMYRVPNGIIYLKYREEYKSGNTLKFNIYDDANTLVRDESSLAVTTFNGYGDNRMEFDLQAAVLPAGNYILEVINDKNEKWYLRFKY